MDLWVGGGVGGDYSSSLKRYSSVKGCSFAIVLFSCDLSYRDKCGEIRRGNINTDKPVTERRERRYVISQLYKLTWIKLFRCLSRKIGETTCKEQPYYCIFYLLARLFTLGFFSLKFIKYV